VYFRMVDCVEADCVDCGSVDIFWIMQSGGFHRISELIDLLRTKLIDLLSFSKIEARPGIMNW
jgi:hypothetical protein